jgi:hypothetical protein
MTAPAALSRIDDGVPQPGDVLIADIFDAQASVVGYRRDRQLDEWAADVCYCGAPATDGECVTCHNDVEAEIVRSVDL